jgi:hypothetical protein
MKTLLGLAIALLLVPGCIMAAPPLKTSYGVGGASGNMKVERAGQMMEGSTATQREWRVAVVPGIGAPRRKLDVGIGYTFERTELSESMYQWHSGPYAEATWYRYASHRGAGEKSSGWRVGPTVLAEAFTDGSGVDGSGAAIGLRAEVYSYTPGGSSCDGSACAAGAGEFGLGVTLQTGVRGIEGGDYRYVMAAIEMRTPAFMAIGVGR